MAPQPSAGSSPHHTTEDDPLSFPLNASSSSRLLRQHTDFDHLLKAAAPAAEAIMNIHSSSPPHFLIPTIYTFNTTSFPLNVLKFLHIHTQRWLAEYWEKMAELIY